MNLREDGLLGSLWKECLIFENFRPGKLSKSERCLHGDHLERDYILEFHASRSVRRVRGIGFFEQKRGFEKA